MIPKLRERPAIVSGVASADRVLRILAAYQRGDQPLELGELAQRTGLVKSTIMRLVFTLEQRGFINRLADGRYQLGSEIFRLSSIYQETLGLEAHVLPVLMKLVQQTGELATFFIRHGVHRLCLYRADSPHLLKVDIKAGDTRPMDQAATAQVLRIFESAAKDKPVPVKIPVFSAGATDPHVASMAVPVIGLTPAIVGAIGIHGPTSRLTPTRAKQISSVLLDAGKALTNTLGGKYPY